MNKFQKNSKKKMLNSFKVIYINFTNNFLYKLKIMEIFK